MTEIAETPTHGYAADKDALVKRLHRIEGQVRGIEKMVLDDHVSHCVAGAIASGDEEAAQEKTAELLKAVHRFAKTS